MLFVNFKSLYFVVRPQWGYVVGNKGPVPVLVVYLILLERYNIKASESVVLAKEINETPYY